MSKSLIERICELYTYEPEETAVGECTLKAQPPKGAKLHSVPEHIRRFIELHCELHAAAGALARNCQPGNDGSVWFTASQEADAIETLICNALRHHHNVSRRHQITLYGEWKYTVRIDGVHVNEKVK